MQLFQFIIDNMQFEKIIKEAKKVIKGQDEIIKAVLTAIVADGHVLLEGPTGVGKTTFVLTFAKIFGLSFRRIQFTSDVLPSDILGTNIYNLKTGNFEFRAGPIFANFVLVDEINRASPKTQSALIEVMEERQVTIEGKTYELEKPFIVFATQNPMDYAGTFPLPITQTDRFLMKINIDYPSKEVEQEILKTGDPRELIPYLNQQMTKDELLKIQQEVAKVTVDDSIVDYISEIVISTRNNPSIKEGLSSRASIHLLKCARAKAIVEGRNYVIPEDVKEIFPYIASHRVICDVPECDVSIFLKDFIEKIPVPR